MSDTKSKETGASPARSATRAADPNPRRVQFERELAGLPYAEQVERIKPGRPIQPVASDSPLQFSEGEANTGAAGEGGDGGPTNAGAQVKASDFKAAVSGTVSTHHIEKNKTMAIVSPMFKLSSFVEGGESMDGEHETGAIQTVVESSRVGHYEGGDKSEFEDYCDPCPVRDEAAEGTTAPWYHGSMPVEVGMPASADMDDTPGTEIPLATPDGKGKLKSTSGKDKFAAWVGVKDMKTGKVDLLKHAVWTVDYTAKIDADAKTGAGSGTAKLGAEADGPGPETPVVGGVGAGTATKTRWK